MSFDIKYTLGGKHAWIFFFDFMKKLCWQYGLGWCKKVLESLRHWPYFQQEVLPRHLLVFGFGLRCLIKDTSICIYTHTQFLFCPLSFTSLILVRCCCCCCCQDTCTLPSWVWYSLHRTYLLLHFGSRSKRVHQGREETSRVDFRV